MDKRSLTERDICTKFITPALRKAGWDEMLQIREEVSFTKGRIIVRGKLVSRGRAKRADYILYYKPNIPLALIEAKDNSHSAGEGMQQGLDYATTLDIPLVFSPDGDGFVLHDRTGTGGSTETTLALDAFPSPGELWARYSKWKGFDADAEQIVLQDYFDDGSGKAPRYYQVNAQQRPVLDHLAPEMVAYWYFRLNGFLQIENFIVHPERRGGKLTEPISLACVSHIAPSAFSTIQATDRG
jgi:type I restriction enzyme, R subunit